MSYDIEELRRALGKKAAFTWAENPDRVQVQKEEEDDTAPDFELDDDGEPYRGVGVDGLLASSEKLLAINRGMADPDERDHMKFQKVISPDNMLRESIKMDAGKTLRTLMYRVSKHRNLNALAPATFDTYVQRLIIGNPLTSSLEEINPMHLMEAARRITKMGPGGLGSSQAITEATQSVNPSQFGFIAPTEGPESEKAGIDTRVARGVRLGSDGRLYQVFREKRTGKLKWMSPADLDGMTIGIPD